MSQFDRQGINQIDIMGRQPSCPKTEPGWQVELATGQKKATADVAKVNELLKAEELRAHSFWIGLKNTRTMRLLRKRRLSSR